MSCKHIFATLLLTAIAFAQTQTTGLSVFHFVAPAYPSAAWLARIEGTTVADVTIKPDGTVDSVEIVSAHPMFRESLEKALKGWSFRNSEATRLRITTRFELEADCPLSGSEESGKRYYQRTDVSADLPSNVEVKTCLPITIVGTDKLRRN